MYEKLIKSVTAKALKVTENDVEVIERLKLGMSNLIFLIKCKDKKYTFRIPGENSEVFVDRNTEKNGLLLIDSYNLCGKTLYFDDNGIKISEYIEGRVLHNSLREQDYKNVADILHNLHNIEIKYVNSYEPFETLNYYESLNTSKVNNKYLKIKMKLLEYKDFLKKQPKVLCHNDCQPSNFVFGDDKKMYLLDYEFIGANDPLYDIACFGNDNIDDGVKLLSAYLTRSPLPDELNRYYLWRTFQNLQWFQVAMYKHELNMDKSLAMNFEDIAYMFLAKAEVSIKCISR